MITPLARSRPVTCLPSSAVILEGSARAPRRATDCSTVCSRSSEHGGHGERGEVAAGGAAAQFWHERGHAEKIPNEMVSALNASSTDAEQPEPPESGMRMQPATSKGGPSTLLTISIWPNR